MNNSPILVKLSMIHKKIQEKNHQNWWTYIDWKIAAKLGKNQSPKTVKISMNPQKFLQKCHQNWWKSDGFTRICTNFVKNQDGLLYVICIPRRSIQKHRRSQPPCRTLCGTPEHSTCENFMSVLLIDVLTILFNHYDDRSFTVSQE